jgi:hypothetical protein
MTSKLPLPTSISKLAQASSGVPMKITRTLTMVIGSMPLISNSPARLERRRQGEESTQQLALLTWVWSGFSSDSSHCRPGDCPFSQRRRALRTHELVQFTRRQNKQETLAHRLRGLAFRAIQLARGEFSELLRHIPQLFTMCRKRSNSTLCGDWSELMRCSMSFL